MPPWRHRPPSESPLSTSAHLPKLNLRWFPDRRLRDARQLIGHSGVQMLGQAALSLPMASGGGKGDVTTAGTALIDAYVPWPQRYPERIVRTTSGHVDTIQVRSLRYALAHLRVATNLAVQASGAGQSASAKVAKSVASVDQGFLNVQVSRFLVGTINEDGLFKWFFRVVGGAAIQQYSDTTAGSKVHYDHSTFLAGQMALQLSIPENDTSHSTAVSILVAAEPYMRRLPDGLAEVIGGRKNIVGVTARFYVWSPKVLGVGAALTYRDIRRVRLESAARWSIEAVVAH